MKKIAMLSILLALTSTGYTATEPPETLLDKITFQLTAKQWVSTKTALLTVNISATLNDADLVKARADIMGSLDKIAKGEWHLLQFDRSQDSSGLEKLSVQAQARVDQGVLTDVYKNAKAASKPGVKYEIGGIEFKPSLEEVQQIKIQLREQLYQQVYGELARINKAYPNQKYSVNYLIFVDGDAIPLQAKNEQARETMSTMAMPAAAPDLTVSQELIMTAVVQAASDRDKEV